MTESKLDFRHDDTFIYELDEVLRKLQIVANRYNITIRVFGSYIKGTAHNNSDIDLLFEHTTSRTLEGNHGCNFIVVKNFITELTKKTVHMCEELFLKTNILFSILDYALIIAPDANSNTDFSLTEKCGYCNETIGSTLEIELGSALCEECSHKSELIFYRGAWMPKVEALKLEIEIKVIR